MATNDFVSVAGDDWYQRRRDDAEGRFFRTVADQGPRKGEGGTTRQGIYIFSAEGKLLAYKNAQDPAVMREVLQRGLQEFRKLPETQRKPGGVKIDDAPEVDNRYHRAPPAGALVVRVYTRILDRDKEGLCRGSCKFTGGDASARDHLWITAPEARAMIPKNHKPGARSPMPAAVAERILRFHLVDNTRGEPDFWARDQIRSQEMTLTVVEADDQHVRLRIDGNALLTTSADTDAARRGYDVRLLGTIQYDVSRKSVTAFDLVAIGEHWGQSRFTGEARPGRTPLGVAFELADKRVPADDVPPQAAREINEYLGRRR